MNGTDPTGMFCCGGAGLPGGFSSLWDPKSIAIELAKAAGAGNGEFGGASGTANAGGAQTATGTTSAGSESPEQLLYRSAMASAAGESVERISGNTLLGLLTEFGFDYTTGGNYSAHGAAGDLLAASSGYAVTGIATGDSVLAAGAAEVSATVVGEEGGVVLGSPGGPVGMTGGLLLGGAVGTAIGYLLAQPAAPSPATAPPN
jgi:hypothetical protein